MLVRSHVSPAWLNFLRCKLSFKIRYTPKLVFKLVFNVECVMSFCVICRWMERCSWTLNKVKPQSFTTSGHPWERCDLWSTTHHGQEGTHWTGKRGADGRHGSPAGSQWRAESQTYRHPDRTAAGEEQGGLKRRKVMETIVAFCKWLMINYSFFCFS